jgi:hypothetical protein
MAFWRNPEGMASLFKTSGQARALCVFLALAAAGAARAEDPSFPAPTGDQSVLPAGAKLDRVFDGGCTLTEGVATSPDGMVYFSDITLTQRCKDSSGKFAQAGNIWKYDPKSKQVTIVRSPSGMSNGMKFDAQGNLIVAEGADFGGRRLTKTDMKTGKSYILTGLYNVNVRCETPTMIASRVRRCAPLIDPIRARMNAKDGRHLERGAATQESRSACRVAARRSGRSDDAISRISTATEEAPRCG